MDYRVILRRFEFDRIMLPRQKIHRLVGGPILSELFYGHRSPDPSQAETTVLITLF